MTGILWTLYCVVALVGLAVFLPIVFPKKTIVDRARLFATKKHKEVNHKRKYTGEDYITHPEAVARIVASVTTDEFIIAAAWLHDTVEDTNTTFEEIEQEFGYKVAGLVEMVTDVSVPEDGNRATRKEIDLVHLAGASPEGKTLKLADVIHNLSSITNHAPDFAPVYMREKAALLEVLGEGDEYLYREAWDIVSHYKWKARDL